jgi:hypothetical protein
MTRPNTVTSMIMRAISEYEPSFKHYQMVVLRDRTLSYVHGFLLVSVIVYEVVYITVLYHQYALFENPIGHANFYDGPALAGATSINTTPYCGNDSYTWGFARGRHPCAESGGSFTRGEAGGAIQGGACDAAGRGTAPRGYRRRGLPPPPTACAAPLRRPSVARGARTRRAAARDPLPSPLGAAARTFRHRPGSCAGFAAEGVRRIPCLGVARHSTRAETRVRRVSSLRRRRRCCRPDISAVGVISD